MDTIALLMVRRARRGREPRTQPRRVRRSQRGASSVTTIDPAVVLFDLAIP
jgi:hypothetical protein